MESNGYGSGGRQVVECAGKTTKTVIGAMVTPTSVNGGFCSLHLQKRVTKMLEDSI
jgi:hypothetical protein